MMANIEIKSEDPDDEHYTMVFTRPKQEKFFEYSDLAKNDISKVSLFTTLFFTCKSTTIYHH